MAEEQQDAGTPESTGETPTFETWIEKQDETTKGLLDKHTSGLRSALSDERSNSKALAKQIADLSKKAEEGSELRAELDRISKVQGHASRKANFYESAPADAGNLKLLWLAAEDAELVDKDGTADWKALREQVPELFRKALVPNGHAGNGATQTGQSAGDMNTFIRRSAGRVG